MTRNRFHQRRGHGRKLGQFIEQLEARCLLATTPIISEFLAVNDTSLVDEDGDDSDWIELRNPTPDPVDLDGWHLTDDAATLEKWTLPAITLDPGEFLVVFASSKNRTDPLEELHTNFRLAGSGEYLALVEPDLTIAHEYSPTYPPQQEDVSYGFSELSLDDDLLETDSGVSVLVPTDNSLGSTWTDPVFVDSGWQTGNGTVGYDTVVPRYFDVVKADAPFAFWRLGETSGVAANRAVAGDGFVGGVGGNLNSQAVSVSGVGSLRGEAALIGAEGNLATRFDGVDDYIHIPDHAELGNITSATRQRTIELWFNADAVPAAGSGEHQVLWEDGGSNNGFNIYLYEDQIFMGAFDNDSGNWVSDSVTSGEIYHVVLTFDSDADQLFGYLNGQKMSEEVVTPFEEVLVHTGDNGIGAVRQDTLFEDSAFVGEGHYFDGVIDEVAIYSDVLSAADIEGHFNAGQDGNAFPPLIGYWPFDVTEGGGATTPDAVGNLDGAVVGATVTTGNLGRFGEALSFDGNDDYVNVGVVNELTTADSFAVSVWFQRTLDGASATNHGINNVLVGHSSGAANDNFELGTQGGNIEGYIDSPSSDSSFTVNGGIANASWHHVVFSYDKDAANEVTVYSDGVLVQQNATFGGNLDSSATSPLTFGMARPDGNNWGDFAGLMDDIAIFDGPLNASNVQSIFNGASPLSGGGIGASFGIDLEPEMFDQQSSAVVRYRFDVDQDPASFDYLDLQAQYDDGFVAYLNGVEVLRENAPAVTGFDSVALSSRGSGEALSFESFDLSSSIVELVQGENVLAVHLLNAAADNSDVLFRPSITASTITGTEDRYFGVPSPGDSNNESFIGFVEDTRFSVDRGYYDAAFQVEITSDTSNATIVYTINGDRPTLTTGTVYSQPIDITTTTVVRAAAFKPGYQETNVDAHTYLFVDDIIQQPANPVGFPSVWGPVPADYEMDQRIVTDPRFSDQITDSLRTHPVMSLSIDNAGFWDPTTGIYANTQQEGREWERDVTVELFDFPGGDSIKANAGIRLQGNASRSTTRPKHNMRLLFRDEYGVDKLEFPLFGDTEFQIFDELILRGGNGDSWIHPNLTQQVEGQYIRDQWLRDSLGVMGHTSPAQDYHHLYINGLYWGLYHTIERPVDDFLAIHFGGDKSEYDVIQHRNETVNGDRAAWDTLMNIVRTQDVTDPAVYEQVLQHIDPANMIDWLLLNYYAGNVDWDHNNWFAGRKREAGATWHFFTWDGERTFIGVNDNVVTKNETNQPTEIQNALMANEEYSTLFADRVQLHFANGGALTPEEAGGRWQAFADDIEVALIAESARWGDHHRPADPFNPAEEWANELNQILNTHIPARSNIVLNQLVSRNWLLSVDAPTFEINGTPQHGGEIAVDDLLSIAATGEAIYYTTDGTDPRAEGGAISPTALLFNADVLLGESTQIRSRVLSGGEWSAETTANFLADNLPSLRITEVMYNPPDDGAVSGDLLEYVEFLNTGTEPIDLTELHVTDGVEFSFVDGNVAILQPDEYTVIVSDATNFANRYDTQNILIAGQYTGGLSNSGERLEVTNQFGQIIVEFTYDDAGSWPGRADGTGASLEPLDTEADLNDGDNWRSSPEYLGSPGRASTAAVGDVVINEILSHTDIPFSDSIELHNTSAGDIDISGWFISDSNDDFFKFEIPATTILDAGEYLVFDESDFNASGNSLPTEFSLDAAHGDDVWLMAAFNGQLERFVDHVEFGAIANGESYGRWPNAIGRLTPMAAQTFGDTNSGPRVGPIVISEVMYALDDPGNVPNVSDLEFIEIHNPTAAAEDLSDWRLDRAVDFTFPQGTMIGVDERIVVISFDPELPENAQRLTAFRDHYLIDASVRLIGGYSGRLDNTGERLELLRPDSPPANEPGFLPMLLEDEVRYEIVAPWPIDAVTTGLSISRLGSDAWGNDGANWAAALPTPGDLDISFVVTTVGINQTLADPVDLPKGPQPTSWQQQRSRLSDVVLTFSQLPLLTVDDLVLTNLGLKADTDNDAVISLTSDHVDLDRNVLTISLMNAGLTQGVYQLEIIDSVTDVLGRPLDGDGDGTGGDEYLLQGDSTNGFYQLSAEYNGDQGVSVFDFTTFSYWFGSIVGIAPEYADNNGDGGVSVFDFTAFSINFGQSVEFPVALQDIARAEVNTDLIGAEVDPDETEEVVRVAMADWVVAPLRRDANVDFERQGSEETNDWELDDLLDSLANDVAQVWQA